MSKFNPVNIIALLASIAVLIFRSCEHSPTEVKYVVSTIKHQAIPEIDGVAKRMFNHDPNNSFKDSLAELNNSSSNPFERHPINVWPVIFSHKDQKLEDEELFYKSLTLKNSNRNNLFEWFNKVENPRVMSLFPQNKIEYNNIYHKKPSITAELKIDKFNIKLNKDPSAFNRTFQSQNNTFSSISDADGNPIVIIAHSEKTGKKVIFPDGTFMSLDEIHGKCNAIMKKCLVLTCYGEDFELDEEISAKNALEIWTSISQKATSGQIKDINSFILEARKIRKKQKERKIIITWASPSVIGGYLMITSIQKYDSKQPITRTANGHG